MSSEFVVNALICGVLLSISAGLIGYFIILRKLTFASHALGHISIPGATGAILLGISPIFGLATFCFVAGILIVSTSKKGGLREISTGTILAFSLALGMFFSSLSTKAAKSMQSVLFGSINLISSDVLVLFACFTVVIVIFFAIFYKKLLFTSVNPEVAEAKGVNIGLINILFIVLLSAVTIMTVQTLGALLPFALLITPAAAAINFTANSKLIIALSIIIGVVCVTFGIIIATVFNLSTSFVIVALIFVVWLISKLFA